MGVFDALASRRKSYFAGLIFFFPAEVKKDKKATGGQNGYVILKKQCALKICVVMFYVLSSNIMFRNQISAGVLGTISEGLLNVIDELNQSAEQQPLE